MPGLIAPPSGITKPLPWAVDPLKTAAPWAWRDARLVLPFWPGVGDIGPYRLSRNVEDAGATGPFGVGEHGPQYQQDGANNTERLYFADHPALRFGVRDFTMLLHAKISSFPTFAGVWLKYDVGTITDRHYGFGTASSTSMYFRPDDGPNKAEVTVNLSEFQDRWAVFVGVRRGDTAELWLDGGLHGTATNASVGSTDSTADLNMGRAYTVDAVKMEVATGQLWGRALGPAEIRQLSADPFAPFRPARRRVLVAGVSGPPEGAATITGTAIVDPIGHKVAHGSASVAGASTATATGAKIASGAASVTGTAAVSATGAATVGGTASIAGDAAVSATGSKIATGTAAVSGSATVAATGTAFEQGGAVSIAGAATVGASGSKIAQGAASVTAPATVEAVGVTIRVGTATITGTALIVSLGVNADNVVPRNHVGVGPLSIVHLVGRGDLSTQHLVGRGTLTLEPAD